MDLTRRSSAKEASLLSLKARIPSPSTVTSETFSTSPLSSSQTTSSTVMNPIKWNALDVTGLRVWRVETFKISEASSLTLRR